MVMRMIWSGWEGLEAKASICHNVRLMRVSTGSHFPLLAQRNAGWVQDGERGTVGRHFKEIQGLFMLVSRIIILICFNSVKVSLLKNIIAVLRPQFT